MIGFLCFKRGSSDEFLIKNKLKTNYLRIPMMIEDQKIVEAAPVMIDTSVSPAAATQEDNEMVLDTAKFLDFTRVIHKLVDEALVHGPPQATTDDQCEKTHKACKHRC